MTESDSADAPRQLEALRAFLRANRDVTVARLALGMSLFIEDGARWAEAGAASAFGVFLSLVGRDTLRWFTTSTLSEWRPFAAHDLPTLEAALRVPEMTGGVRHLLGVEVADDPGVPLYSFRYREVDDSRFARLGYVQMFVPFTFAPAAFEDAVFKLLGLGPFACGLAGPTAVWDPRLPRTAFGAIYGWCRRFLGIEVVDADAAGPSARNGLPGTSWLTMIGSGLAERLEIDTAALESRSWKGEARASVTPHGIFVRASAAPDLGDLNTLRYPSGLADVARAFDPYLAPDLPPLPNRFEDPDLFAQWRRRFVAPEGWAR
jgi:hypothetical protein